MSQDFKSANSAKIGKVFFDARENSNLSLEEISSHSLINIKYLIAIECGDYSDFPSEGFARAYFRKYAKFFNQTKTPNLIPASMKGKKFSPETT